MFKILRLSLMTLFFLGIAGVIVYYQIEKLPVVHNAVDEMDVVGGPFDLIDQDGKPCKSGDFKGKYLIVYFGYSHCPDACPRALRTITEALTSLKRDRDQVAAVFITMDPSRDTVQELKTYSENYNENMFFLTGDKKAIDAVAKAYKTYAKKVNSGETTEYLIDHSTLIYLLDREGKQIAYFMHTVEPEKLSNALLTALNQEHKHNRTA